MTHKVGDKVLIKYRDIRYQGLIIGINESDIAQVKYNDEQIGYFETWELEKID